MSSGSFLATKFFDRSIEPRSKPYLMLRDDPSVPYGADDLLEKGVALGAKRSTRIAYACKAKQITTILPSLHSDAGIFVLADEESENAVACIQAYVAKHEIMSELVWLTDKELIF